MPCATPVLVIALVVVAALAQRLQVVGVVRTSVTLTEDVVGNKAIARPAFLTHTAVAANDVRFQRGMSGDLVRSQSVADSGNLPASPGVIGPKLACHLSSF
jgi:hypothetical protein